MYPNLPNSLYDPKFEHDACGVGFVANINGKRGASHIWNMPSRRCAIWRIAARWMPMPKPVMARVF